MLRSAIVSSVLAAAVFVGLPGCSATSEEAGAADSDDIRAGAENVRTLIEGVKGTALGFDGAYVYYESAGAISRVSREGGAATKLAASEGGLALDEAGSVYTMGASAIVEVSGANTGSPKTSNLAEIEGKPTGIAYRDGFVYYTAVNRGEGRLWRVKTSGGAPEHLGELSFDDQTLRAVSEAGAFISDGKHISFFDFGTKTLKLGPLHPNKGFLTSADLFENVVVRGTAAYWTGKTMLVKTDFAPGASEYKTLSDRPTSGPLAIAGEKVYWATPDGILATSLSNPDGGLTVVKESDVTALRTDAKSIVWRTDDGAIRSAKITAQ